MVFRLPLTFDENVERLVPVKDDTRDLNQQTLNCLNWKRHTGQHRAESRF